MATAPAPASFAGTYAKRCTCSQRWPHDLGAAREHGIINAFKAAPSCRRVVTPNARATARSVWSH
jgi:hypothetical protein